MENFDKKCEGEGCKSCCGMHSMMGHGCHGGKHHLVKIILKIVIVVLIFWCGFKLGEITGAIRGQYGYKVNEGGYGMMRGWNGYFNTNGTSGEVQLPTQTPAPVK